MSGLLAKNLSNSVNARLEARRVELNVSLPINEGTGDTFAVPSSAAANRIKEAEVNRRGCEKGKARTRERGMIVKPRTMVSRNR